MSIQSMFYRAYAFNRSPCVGFHAACAVALASEFRPLSLSAWDVCRVTNMWEMFKTEGAVLIAAGAFDGELAGFDVSRVRGMGKMFQGARLFNRDISTWDVSHVTNMQEMFYMAKAFNQDLSTWNVGRVHFMLHMFYSAETFNQDLSAWDVSQVTSMNSMFNQAKAFNQDLSAWDISLLTQLDSSMFMGPPLPPSRSFVAVLWPEGSHSSRPARIYSVATYPVAKTLRAHPERGM